MKVGSTWVAYVIEVYRRELGAWFYEWYISPKKLDLFSWSFYCYSPSYHCPLKYWSADVGGIILSGSRCFGFPPFSTIKSCRSVDFCCARAYQNRKWEITGQGEQMSSTGYRLMMIKMMLSNSNLRSKRAATGVIMLRFIIKWQYVLFIISWEMLSLPCEFFPSVFRSADSSDLFEPLVIPTFLWKWSQSKWENLWILLSPRHCMHEHVWSLCIFISLSLCLSLCCACA